MGELIGGLLEARGAGDPRAATAALRAGDLDLALGEWRVADGRFWVLSEPRRAVRGAGVYAIRIDRRRTRRPVLLQVPHAYFELRLSEIAADLFFAPGRGLFDGLFGNSLHRFQSEPGARTPRDDSPADVCHNPEHWFTEATRAAARGLGRTVVVQLHGFDETSQQTAAGVYAIVSGGDRAEPTALATAFTERLGETFGDGALLYPRDTDVLGGTMNLQGQAVRDLRGREFLHIELGRKFRERLAASSADARAFADALGAAIESLDEESPSE